MKICTKCSKLQPKVQFYKDKRSSDGLYSECMKCSSLKMKRYQRSLEGLVTRIYASQKENSQKRNHKLPNYTKKELLQWMLQNNYKFLHKNWILNNYFIGKTPSCDRLNDSMPYSLDNLRLVTWQENKDKSHSDQRKGILVNGKNPQKPILQFTKEGKFIKEYHSISEAERQLDVIDSGSISRCCNGHKKYSHAYGFVWKFKNNKEQNGNIK